MKIFRLASFLFLAGAALTYIHAAEVTVFAAASLTDALDEIAPLYAKATGDSAKFNFGGSGTLARQIREGAPADVFFSADELRVDQLEKSGLLLAGTRRTLLANALVVVVAADGGAPVAAVADLLKPGVRRVVIGEPATVPAGTYAKDYLLKVGAWDPLLDKMVPVENVRSVLAAVESGNADAGFVYKTDALISKRVKIAVLVPPGEGPRISYPVAVVKDSKSPDAARGFVEFLAAPQAQAVFAKFGFLAPN